MVQDDRRQRNARESDTFDEFFDIPVERTGTHCMKWDGMESVFGEAELLPFWVADMDFRVAPEILQAMREQLDHAVFGYPLYHDGVKEAVARWQTERHGWKVDPSWVCHAPGVVPGMTFAILALTQPGDPIVIQPPVYPPFFAMIRDNGRVVVENPLAYDGKRCVFDLENLENVLASSGAKLLVLSSPHNPVGRVWTCDELAALARTCAAHGVTILSDEIHQDIVYRDAHHVPIASIDPEFAARSITFVAPSKTFNLAGLQTSAAIISNPALRETYQAMLHAVHIERPNQMGLAAMLAAYTRAGAWADRLVAYLERSRAHVEEFVSTKLEGVRMDHPEGMYVYWIDFRGTGLSPEELQERLVHKGRVALNDGRTFGAQGAGFARLNAGCPHSQLEEGLARIAQALGA